MAFVYRAFYAVPPMANQAGMHTNAAFGFHRMLQSMINHTAPDFIAVLFDTAQPTFRHEVFPEYKAQRPPMPDDLAEQIPWIKEFIRALNIACLEYPGYEADDVIGTIARNAEEQNVNVLIATSDKDLCQLVSDNIGILNVTMRATNVIDPRGVKEKFGVEPEQIIDYLTLVGDTADNVPGVNRIGAKTAQALLTQFGTIEELYHNIDELKPAIKKGLEDAREMIDTFRGIIRIKCDVPVNESLNDLLARDPDDSKLAKIREYLDFRSPFEKRTTGAQTQPELF